MSQTNKKKKCKRPASQHTVSAERHWGILASAPI